MRHGYPRHTSLLSLTRTRQIENLAQQLCGEFLHSKYGIFLNDYVGVPLSGWCWVGIEHWPFRDPNQWDVVPFLRPTLYLGPYWEPTQPLRILTKTICLVSSNMVQRLYTRVGAEHSLIPTWHPRWQKFGAKSSGYLEKTRTRFSLAQTLNLGRIGLICWIMNIFTISLWRITSLH